MLFPDVIYDDTLNSISNHQEFFNAPISGLYEFFVFLSIDVSEGFDFEIEVLVNLVKVQSFNKKSPKFGSSRSESFEFYFNLILNENDTVRYRSFQIRRHQIYILLTSSS